jgi:hypothetical protein
LTKSTHSFARRSKNLLAAFCVVLAGNLFFLSHARAEDVVPPEVTTIVTNGGDDVSYHIPLTVSVVYDGVTYENVYATTNSVITFGRPDGTYWTYPTTPSISIESKDWWVLPQQMPDTHFIINVSEGGFQVDGNYRPYGTLTGDTTSIVITAQIQTDGTVAYTYATSGPLSGTERTGARLTDGTIVTLEQAGVTQVEEVPVLEPVPVSPTPEPEPVPVVPEPVPVVPEPVVPEPEVVQPPAPRPLPPFVPVPEPVEPPMVEPEPQPEPAPEPAPEPPVVEPEPEIVPEEPPAPEEEPPTEAEEPPVEAEPAPEEAPEPPTEEEVLQAEDVEASELPADTPIELANGVVLTAGVVAALELFDNPAELLSEVFTNPAQVLTALSNIGADMSEEERQESTETILAAVIVGQIATQSAVAAAASAAAASSTYRRKP